MTKVLSLKEDVQIVKANAIIEAKYKLSLIEQKLILIMASMIHQEDTDLKFYRVNTKDLMRVLDIDKSKYGSAYEKIRKSIYGLGEKPLYIKNNKKGWLLINWVASAEYKDEEGIIEFEFSEKIKPYLLQLKKNFTSYRLRNIIKLKSAYSIRIYELLKQYEKIGRRKFDLDDLKERLIINNKYKKYNDFKRKVLEVAFQELPERSDIAFDYREIKTGRKTTGIEFFNIRANIPPEANFGQLSLDFPVEVSDARKSSKTPVRAKNKAINKDLEERGVSPKQISELVSLYGNKHFVWRGERYSIIEFYCEYFDWQMKQPKHRPEGGAWIYKAIKDEWKPPQTFKTKREVKLEQEKLNEQKNKKEREQLEREEQEQRDEYFEWLKLTPEQRWKHQEFEFRLKFSKEHKRKATEKELKKAKEEYLANPETPKQYQLRMFKKVKFPTKL